MAQQISAIIPAYNEADLIGDTVRAALGIPGVSQVVVVDDGSGDATADAARSAGAHTVVRLERNLGKGGALNESLKYARGDILLLLDADLGASASQGEKLLSPVLSGEADMCVAVFGEAEDERSGGAHLAARSGGFGIVMKTARWGIRLLTGKSVKSPLAGPRALRREIVEKVGGFEPRFGVEVGFTVDALRMGYRLQEVPVAMVHRPSGRDFRGFVHRGGQLVDVLRVLARKSWERRR